MDPSAYSVITSANPLVFHLAMRELLENWDPDSDDLVALFSSIAGVHPTPVVDSETDSVNPICLLAGYVESIGASSFEEFITMLTVDEEEPNNYSDATRSPYFSQWLKAMREELDSLLKNHTWDIVDSTPDGRKPLDGRWVYKLKRNADGVIVRYKARWCVKGFLQQYGIDFDQTFASVVKPMAFRVLFAVAAFLNLEIEQMDVKWVWQ
jgi:hypothetical protein